MNTPLHTASFVCISFGGILVAKGTPAVMVIGLVYIAAGFAIATRLKP